MIEFVIGYVFIGVCTSFSVYSLVDKNLLASILVGMLWPMSFTIRIINKFLY